MLALQQKRKADLICYRVAASREGYTVQLAEGGGLQGEGGDAERVREARFVPLKQLWVVANLET
jgi:hypothetical protein